MILKRNLLSAALASAILMSATGAHAHPAAPGNQPQDSSSQGQQSSSGSTSTAATKTAKKKKKKSSTLLGAVEVTGFASSVQNSIALKRDSNSIVEAVSAEQIGKLPGTSIADSLGRLPGLAVQTVDGRPQVLSIHGLGPDFSTALINGNQQVSTSNNRDVQFDQYPSSWFDNVVVHMSPSASLIGQGLSGTVDMHTIRPLDKSKPQAAINAHYIWDSAGQLAKGPGVSDKGYQVNGVYVNQFADHTFGITLGIDLDSNPSQIKHQAPWGYPNDANGNLVVGGVKNYGISDQMKRQGYLATFQWRPSDNYTSTLDLTYDKFNETQQAKGMEFPLYWGSGVTLQPGNVSNGFVQSGTYANVKTVVRNDYNKTRAKVWNIDWSNDIRFNEDWSAKITANYSRAQRKDKLLESYAGTGYGVGGGATDTIGFSERPGGLLYLQPALDYTSGMVLTDPQGWGGGATPPVVQAGFINAPRTDDYLANLRASVKREFANGPISSVEFGVNRGTRNKTYNIDQNFLILPNGAQTSAIPNAFSSDPLSWMGVGPQVTYNPLQLISNGTYQLFPTALSSISVPPNWKVRERDTTAYVQFNLDTYMGNMPVRGNFGVQEAWTGQSSYGQYVSASAGGTNGSNVSLKPNQGGTHFSRFLPSANLVFSLTDNDDLRVGAARTMARPRMDQMSSSIGLNTDITHLSSTNPNQSYFSASGGNAKLMPTMADNYNVSYEHYFTGNSSGYKCNSNDAKQSALCQSGGAGYISASAYFLELSDFIDPNAAYQYDFAAFVPSYLTAAQQQQLGTTQGIVSGPVNDGSGYVKGAQVTVNLPLDYLSRSLNGFGVILTGDYTKSSLVLGSNPNPITVPGLSKWVANGTLYYQHKGFEARVSDSYRSSFLGRVSGISATRQEQTIKGGSSYDAQVSYTIGSGSLNGLTIIFQGSNLSDKKFVTYQNNDPRQVQTWESYGRRYDLGVSYKFR
ncbi:TonB-dependent receptor [Oleiagrimonas sp.]|jgi:iron complex outermembrane receptor protein|uniref:TonB-dependent receptor n=1 Tax=Oleiagrimonas sp. TaxID=2010330 RepID=UPI0026323FED|nr:TonB-dependent receptor [Oleiagrimonas sp.]MDA3914998.1 TonB-dependent receptor [Oleiagrimonas sp.]